MEHSTEKLLIEAEKALDKFEPEIAIKFYERIFENSADFQIANQIANCAIQLQDFGLAESWLIKSLEIEPNQFFALLQLGQLKTGREAATLYFNAINAGNFLISQTTTDLKLLHELKREVANALCALCELYMTDLCDEQDAEQKCEEFMNEAYKLDPQNPEVYQTTASVRISQCRVPEAAKLLQDGMDLWYQELTTDEPLVHDQSWPTYTSRLALAKLLIEVECFDRAISIIETLECENDEDFEVWYLFSWTFMQKSQAADTEERLSLLADAKECLQALIEVQTLIS